MVGSGVLGAAADRGTDWWMASREAVCGDFWCSSKHLRTMNGCVDGPYEGGGRRRRRAGGVSQGGESMRKFICPTALSTHLRLPGDERDLMMHQQTRSVEASLLRLINGAPARGRRGARRARNHSGELN